MENLSDIKDLFDINQIYKIRAPQIEYLSSVELPTELDVIDEEDYDYFCVNLKFARKMINLTSRYYAIIIGNYYLIKVSTYNAFIITKIDNITHDGEAEERTIFYEDSFHDVHLRYYEIAKDIYGEDNVKLYGQREIPFNFQDTSRVKLGIRVTDLIIENKYGLKLKMPDFIFFLKFNNNSLNTSFYGTRSKFSSLEREKGYIHSHYVSHTVYNTLSIYCAGGSESLLTRALNRAYEANEEDEVYNLFYSINNFLRWEDIDSVPHKHLKTLLSETRNNRFEYHDLLALIHDQPEVINIYQDISGPELEINFDQLSTQSNNNSYRIGTRSYKNIWDNYSIEEHEPFQYLNGELITFDVWQYDPFILDALNTSNLSALSLSDTMKTKATLYFKSKLIDFLNYDTKPTPNEKRIKDTLIGLEKVSRLSKNNSF